MPRQNWTFIVPPRTRSVLFLYAPTRSILSTAKFVQPRPFDDVTVDTDFGGLAAAAPMPSGFVDLKTSTEIVLQTETKGEPLRLITVRTNRTRRQAEQESDRLDRLTDQQRGKQARFESRKNGDHRHLFFHKLDRNTNRLYLRFTRLSEARQQERYDLIERVQVQLLRQLANRCPGDSKPVDLDKEDLRAITKIFRKAARRLCRDGCYDRVGAALKDFAAGWLRRIINVDLDGDGILYPQVVNEPDSSNIFLFAELALAAQDIDTEFWKPNIPVMVQMQRYFLARFPEPCRCEPLLRFDAYRTPEAVLDESIRGRLDGEPTEPVDDVIAANLKQTDTEPWRQGTPCNQSLIMRSSVEILK